MEEYAGSVNRAFSQYHDEFVTGCESRTARSASLATGGMGSVTDGRNDATDERRMRTGLDGAGFFAAQTELNLVPDQREKKPFQMHAALQALEFFLEDPAQLLSTGA